MFTNDPRCCRAETYIGGHWRRCSCSTASRDFRFATVTCRSVRNSLKNAAAGMEREMQRMASVAVGGRVPRSPLLPKPSHGDPRRSPLRRGSLCFSPHNAAQRCPFIVRRFDSRSPLRLIPHSEPTTSPPPSRLAVPYSTQRPRRSPSAAAAVDFSPCRATAAAPPPAAVAGLYLVNEL